MRVWEKPEIWELSAKYTECGIPIIPRCHSGGGSSSGCGSRGYGDNKQNKNKYSTGKRKRKQKQFNLLSWLFGRYT